jgi:hypothetical protein
MNLIAFSMDNTNVLQSPILSSEIASGPEISVRRRQVPYRCGYPEKITVLYRIPPKNCGFIHSNRFSK